MTIKRIRLLVNPSARSGRGRRRLAAALASLPADVRLDVIESASATHLQTLVRTAQADDLHALALAGGDGTLTLALNALTGLNRVPLALVPTGSGNDFAADLGIPCNLPAALRLLHEGQPCLVDVACASWPGGSQRYGCVASVGLDTAALRIIHSSRLPRCKALNLVAALLALCTSPPCPLRVTWPGGGFEGEVLFAAVTNTRGYGGGFLVSPDASLGDGLLDLCIVRRTGRLRLLSQFPRILRGTHAALPEVILARASEVRIEGLHADVPAALDGELPHARTPLELRCEPQAVRMLGPATVDFSLASGRREPAEEITPMLR